MYTPSTYSSGSSLSHIDDRLYAGTSNYLMRPFSTGGSGMDAMRPSSPTGSIGDAILGIFRNMGYITK
ncbi:hypothetical protein BC831DRAFT_461494 [Entophlyctis helioformis]|nr:hypothetical protein BC831DRAFT_461494 [Entophlyctis helioformis]